MRDRQLSQQEENLPWGRRETFFVIAASLTFGFVFSYPILQSLNFPGVGWDWDFNRTLAWVSWVSVVKFHQFPVWNPYVCGGIPMMGDPQSSIITPFFPIHLLLGPVVGLNLEIPLHLAVAWSGGYFLGRTIGFGRFAAATCATVFPASSWFYLRAAVGQHPFFAAAYCPWILAFALLAIDRRRIGFAALSGLLVALVFLEGAPHQTSFVVLVLSLLLAAVGIARLSLWPYVVLASILFFAAGFGAVKIIPASAVLQAHPRATDTREGLSPGEIATALFDRYQDCHHDPIRDSAFWEIGAYLGPIFGGLALIGGIFRRREAWPWTAAAMVLLVLTLGNFSPYAPWTLLHRLPMFSSERIVTRMLVMFIFCTGVLAAYGVDFLIGVRLSWVPETTIVLVAFGILDALLVSPSNLAYFLVYHEQPVESSVVFRQFQNPDSLDYELQMLHFSQANFGVARCYEYTYIPTTVRGYNEAEYNGEQYLVNPGQVKLLKWSPNRLDLQVDTTTPNILVFNQNYDRGWWLAKGIGRIGRLHGLLAMQLPPGTQQIKLINVGDGLIKGAILTLLTAIVATFVWRMRL